MPIFQRHTEGTPLIEIELFRITQDENKKEILSFKADKAPGPDGLYPEAIRELASVLL